MKYKNLAIFLCLFLVSHSATAQRKARLNTIDGEQHKPPKGSRGTLVNFEHQGNYYYLTAAGPLYVIVTPIGGGVGGYPSGFNLVQLDNKAAIKNTLKVEVPPTPERVYYENYAILGDFIYVFYSIRNRETKKNNLFTTKIDMSTKKQSLYKVGEVPSKKEKSDGREVLSIFTSKNQKFMSLVYTKGNILVILPMTRYTKPEPKARKKLRTIRP